MQCYSVADLLSIDYPGDDKVREFWNLCEAYIRYFQDTVTEATKRDIEIWESNGRFGSLSAM
eukprot:10465925-Lingulodinium_polyedra.AAC.1